MKEEENIIKMDECVKHTLVFLISEKRFVLGGFAYKNLSVDRIEDLARTKLLYSVRTLIPAEKLKEETHTVTVEYPGSWWQAFKEQYFPLWLKAKCPIKYKTKSETVTFIAYTLYPKFPAIMPERCVDAIQTIVKTVDSGAEE
jgi:hypothetical protein